MPLYFEPKATHRPGHVAPHPRPERYDPRPIQRSYSDVVAGRRTPHSIQNYSQLTQRRNFWNQGERLSRRSPYRTDKSRRLAPSSVSIGHKKSQQEYSRPQGDNENNQRAKQPSQNAPDNDSSHIRNKQDPEYKTFSSLVKRLYDLIRSYHHQEKVSNDNEPITFSRLTRFLTGVIKPCRITPLTKSLLEGNARNWAYTTKLILQDHYAKCIDGGEEALKDLLGNEWRAAFEIAVKWYQNKFGKRHMAEPIQKVEELLISLTGQPDEAPSPTAIVTLEEEVQNTTEFPALNRNWHSPQPSPITPPPVQPSTEPLPPRTVKKLRGSASKQTLENHNPAVANVDEVPDFFAINTCPITCNTVETPRAAFVQKPQGDILSQIVMVHPETPNPQLDQGTEESPQIRAVDESAVDALLCISEDDMEQNILPMPQLTPIATPTPSPRVFRTTRHMKTPRKLVNWTFTARRKWCIVGDSNLSRFPPHNFENLQIDSYPGATFRHAEAFLSKANIQTQVETIVLAFGINHRAQKQKETAIKQLQRAVKVAKERFPQAAIWIPLINYSKNLKKEEKDGLTELNAHIRRNMPYLPLLPEKAFEVGQDQIHWTPTCAKGMFDHWCKHLNFRAL